MVDEAKAGEEDKGREELPVGARAYPGQCQPRSPALRAHLSASRSPPTASLVLLNQQSQGLGLSQGHIGIHAEVVGTAVVLAAQVPAGRGRRVSGRGVGIPVPASSPRQGDTGSLGGEGAPVSASPPRVSGVTRSCTLHP